MIIGGCNSVNQQQEDQGSQSTVVLQLLIILETTQRCCFILLSKHFFSFYDYICILESNRNRNSNIKFTCNPLWC